MSTGPRFQYKHCLIRDGYSHCKEIFIMRIPILVRSFLYIKHLAACVYTLMMENNLMSRRHTDNWSHPGQYLVYPYTWPCSPNGHGHGHEWPTATPLVQCQSALPFSYFKIRPWKSMIKVMCGQRSRSRLTFKIQRSRLWSRSNPLVTFEFRNNRTTFGWDIANSIFDLENSMSRSWPRWYLMVTFEALEFNRYVYFRFVSIGPFLADI